MTCPSSPSATGTEEEAVVVIASPPCPTLSHLIPVASWIQCVGSNFEGGCDGLRKGEEAEGGLPLDGLGGLRARVRQPKVPEPVLRPLRRVVLEAPPRLLGENAVRDVGAHVLGPLHRKQLLTLDQRPSGLHQVVHNDHVLPRRLALLEPHDALVAVPHLGADDFRVARKEHVKAFPGSLVWVGDDDLLSRRGQLLELGLEEGDAGLEEREHGVAEVEALLEGVDVEDDEGGGAPAGQGNVGQDARQREGGRDLALGLDPLRRARREEGQHEGERAHEHPRQRVDDRQLLKNQGRVVETGQEGHVAVPQVLRVLDEQVGEPVREVLPRDFPQVDLGAGV
mmetsp:Transcript_12904/g.33433  ORF Transcript_12904/g.33433 Transcript_12904/m.33433 type:complete len:339 (-) Transcript_12904:246-1262(-)